MSIHKEIRIYHNIPHKKYRWISYVSFFNISFISVNLFFIATPKLLRERTSAIKDMYLKKEVIDPDNPDGEPIIEYELDPNYDDTGIFKKIFQSFRRDIFTLENFTNNFKERPYYCSGLLTSSILVGVAFTMYARRMVHTITLLPANRVRLQFFNPLPIGKPITRVVHLRDISCQQDRNSKHNYSILRLKGSWGYHLVHKTEGEFLHPKLYDKYLGYQRSWAIKDK